MINVFYIIVISATKWTIFFWYVTHDRQEAVDFLKSLLKIKKWVIKVYNLIKGKNFERLINRMEIRILIEMLKLLIVHI